MFSERRGTPSRLQLRSLLDHKDRFVRYYAAVKLLGILPEPARQVLEWNWRYRFDALSWDAGMLLLALDRGEYKPD